MSTKCEQAILDWIRDHRSHLPDEGVSVSETNLHNAFPSPNERRTITRMITAGKLVRDTTNGRDRVRIPLTNTRWRVFVNGENTGCVYTGVTPAQAAIDYLTDRGAPDAEFALCVTAASVRELR